MERTLVLGLGNVLCSDDGLGVEAVRRLAAEHELPQQVDAVDGGTLGLSLLGVVTASPRVILVDAVIEPEPPGTLVRLTGEDVADAARERLSVHQVGVADLLDAARLLGREPPELVLVGLVPGSAELGVGLTAGVEAAMPALVDAVAEELRRFGNPVRRRSGARVLDRRRARRAS